MKLHGFETPCLNLGQIEINVTSENPIACCSQCETYVSKVMTSLHCKHVLCDMCCINVGSDRVLCKICEDAQDVKRRKVHDENVICTYVVVCSSCEEEMELKDFKQHLLDEEECLYNNYQIMDYTSRKTKGQTEGTVEIFGEINNCTNKLMQTIINERVEIEGTVNMLLEKMEELREQLEQEKEQMKQKYDTLLQTMTSKLKASEVSIQRDVALSRMYLETKSKVISIRNINALLSKIRRDPRNNEHSSDPFVCGGVKWRLGLALDIAEHQRGEHYRSCLRQNTLSICKHFEIGIYWYPQRSEDDYPFYPIIKKLTFEIVNMDGVNFKHVIETFSNGSFESSCFQRYNGSGYGATFHLKKDEIVVHNDSIRIKVTVKDI